MIASKTIQVFLFFLAVCDAFHNNNNYQLSSKNCVIRMSINENGMRSSRNNVVEPVQRGDDHSTILHCFVNIEIVVCTSKCLFIDLSFCVFLYLLYVCICIHIIGKERKDDKRKKNQSSVI